MPNYCTNELFFNRGSKIARMIIDTLDHLPEDAGMFSYFKPCPKDLKITADMYASMLDGTNPYSGATGSLDERYEQAKAKIESVFGNHTGKDAVAAKMGTLDNLRKAYDNVKAYGYPTWYEFALAEWGTKWDVMKNEISFCFAYDDESETESKYAGKEKDRKFRMRFETADCPPIGILEKISGIYPNEAIAARFFFEGEEEWTYAVIRAGKVDELPDKRTAQDVEAKKNEEDVDPFDDGIEMDGNLMLLHELEECEWDDIVEGRKFCIKAKDSERVGRMVDEVVLSRSDRAGKTYRFTASSEGSCRIESLDGEGAVEEVRTVTLQQGGVEYESLFG